MARDAYGASGAYGRGDGLLEVNCTCEQSIVLATPQQVRDGTPMSCGLCPGVPSRPLGRAGTGRGPGRPRGPESHGTEAAYQRHRRAGTPPCDACKQAQARAAEGRRTR